MVLQLLQYQDLGVFMERFMFVLLQHVSMYGVHQHHLALVVVALVYPHTSARIKTLFGFVFICLLIET